MMDGQTVLIDAENASTLIQIPKIKLQQMNWKRTANAFADEF